MSADDLTRVLCVFVILKIARKSYNYTNSLMMVVLIILYRFFRHVQLSSQQKGGNLLKCLQQSSMSKNELWIWCEGDVGTGS